MTFNLTDCFSVRTVSMAILSKSSRESEGICPLSSSVISGGTEGYVSGKMNFHNVDITALPIKNFSQHIIRSLDKKYPVQKRDTWTFLATFKSSVPQRYATRELPFLAIPL